MRVTRDTVAGRAYLDLQNKARRDARPTDELLQLYAFEGFLDRLAGSPYHDHLVLKGGVLLAAFDTRRPTRDVDLHAENVSNDTQSVLSMVRTIVAVPRDDGLLFSPGPARAVPIRDEGIHSGVRINVPCELARARSPFHVDVNLGDAVWPDPGTVNIPRLLGGYIAVRGYPLSMVLAEKIVTAVERGSANTRWRDFLDICLLSGGHEVDADELSRSVTEVASHRSVRLKPLRDVLDGYGGMAQSRWAGWLRKQQLIERAPMISR